MTNDGAPQRQTRNRHRSEPPALRPALRARRVRRRLRRGCGRRSRRRVLAARARPASAALGHRGAFAADGESSDGAGRPPAARRRRSCASSIRRNRRRPAGRAHGLPAPAAAERRPGRGPRSIVAAALAAEGLARRRAGARCPSRPTPSAAWPPPRCPRSSRRSSRGRDGCPTPGRLRARARLRPPPRRRGGPRRRPDGFAVVSASSRTVVYKGLVAGGRLPALFPGPRVVADRRRSRCSTSATPPTRSPRGRSPSRSGSSPTTARSTPSAATARRPRPARRRRRPVAPTGRAPTCSAPPVRCSRRAAPTRARSTRRSSCWSRPAGRSRPRCSRWCPRRRACAARRTRPSPPSAAGSPDSSRRGTARRALVFSDGRRVGALLDRNGLRPAAWPSPPTASSRVASEAGAVPLDPARDRAHAAAWAPGELLLVDPAAGRVLDDADAKSWSCAACRSTTRRATDAEDRPVRCGRRRRPAHRARRVAADRRPALLAGLDAERRGLDVQDDGARGHEPLWSMGDDTPLAGRAGVDRPAVDHLRQAFAQVTNPPIDPERERAVMDLRVELGPPAGAPGRHARAAPRPSASDGRSSPTSTGCSTRSAAAPGHRTGPCAGSTRPGPAAGGRCRARGRARPARRRRAATPPGRTEVLVLSDAAASLGDRRGCPSRPSSRSAPSTPR